MAQTPRIQIPINSNAPALSLPGSDQIRGVLIDNPSGAWLILRTTNEYIPPYTIGFARSFEYGHTSIAIEWASAGPAGQVSTLQGDPAAVQLFSDPVANSSGDSSGGRSFVEQFTPVSLSYTMHFITTIAAYDTNILPAINGKRYRILTANFSLQPFFSVPPTNYDSGVLFDLYLGGTTTDIATGKLSPANRVANFIYPSGADCPVGGPNINITGAVRFSAQCDWANSSMSVSLTYQVL